MASGAVRVVLLFATAFAIFERSVLADTESCLTMIETETRITWNQLRGCEADLRRASVGVDYDTVLRRLLDIVSNEARPTEIREYCIHFLVSDADSKNAAAVVQKLRQLGNVLTFTNEQREALQSVPRVTAVSKLVASVIRGGLGPLIAVCSDLQRRELMTWIGTMVADTTYLSLEVKHLALKILLTDLREPKAAQQDTIVTIIVNASERSQLSRILVEAVDPVIADRLLRVACEWAANGRIHYGCLAAVSHYGSLTARRLVQDLMRQHTDKKLLHYYAWQIDVQDPPIKLLDYIASADAESVEKRIWAIHRAVDRAISKEQIRQAILEHSAKLTANQFGIKPGLASIKTSAMELGVLRDGDLPDMKGPKDVPTP